MPNTFFSTTDFLLDRFIPLLPPARFHYLSTPHLLLAPSAPLDVGLRIFDDGTLSHRRSTLHWWKTECVESLVELHCMYCTYGIKIVFCSSPVSVLPPLCLPGVKPECCKTIELTPKLEKNNKEKQFCLFANTNCGNLQFPVYQTPVGCFYQASKL